VTDAVAIVTLRTIELEWTLICIFLRSELSFVSYLRQRKRLRRAPAKLGRGQQHGFVLIHLPIE
jgi:hypothetical protein